MIVEKGAYAGVGFLVSGTTTIIEAGGPSLEALFNGMLGALGALIVKEVYDFIKVKLKQKKTNGKVE